MQATRDDNYKLIAPCREIFTKTMEELGFTVSPISDTLIPELIALKDGHLSIRMIMFLDPGRPGISVHGSLAPADLSYVFYYQLANPIEPDMENRFRILMDAVSVHAKKGYRMGERKEF